MASFQSIVLSVAGIILAIFIVFIGIFLYRNRSNLAYPPVVAQCPDYWLNQMSDGQNTCLNVKNLGSSSCGKNKSFSTSEWNGKRGLCNKSKWARSCNLAWDGITTNKDICKY